MMTPTHVTCTNGAFWMELDDAYRPIPDQIARLLGILDGTERYSLLLWKLPEGADFRDVDLDDANEYMQCAGSADKMTVEVRRITDSGPEQFVVGRPQGSAEPEESAVTINWNKHHLVVAPNEVFAAPEAAALFVEYYETGWVPSSYSLRRLNLSEKH
jgi:hypothetical protein